MTAQPRPMGEEPFATEPERALDAYAEATRITASAMLVRRFQSGVAQERAARRRPGDRVRGLLGRLGWRAPRPGVTSLHNGTVFALRLQGLALLLLLVLAMGLVAGGAGAAIMTLLDGSGRGSHAPADVIHLQPTPVPAPTPAHGPVGTPAPSLRVQPLAQQAPARHRAGDRRASRHRATGRASGSERPAGACRSVTGQPQGSGLPSPAEPARPHAGRWTCAF